MGDWDIGDPFEENPAQPHGGSAGPPQQPTPGSAEPLRPPGGPRPLNIPLPRSGEPPRSAPGGPVLPLESASASPEEPPPSPPAEPAWEAAPTTPLPVEPTRWQDDPRFQPPDEPQSQPPPEEPGPGDEDLEETTAPPPPRRSRTAAPPTASSRKLWVFALLGLAVGILIGVGLLAWLRAAMLADQRTLERRVRTVEASSTMAAGQVASLTTQLSNAEASITALASQNESLTAQLASATASLSEANSKLAVATKTLTITERSASPASVVKGQPLVLEVKIQGSADKVQMKLLGLSPVSYSQTYTLTKVGTTAGIQTWRRTVTAPSTVGTYRYYATAFIGTKEFEMSGVSAWTFEVKDAP